MKIKRHIPNTITCCNLICGCIATGFAFDYEYAAAFGFIILGAVFDFFDGFTARLLHVSSPIGKELDSLADDITFGFAPATIVFSMLRGILAPDLDWMAYSAFLIAAFSALRLAKFNLDERQSMGFIGLPTPANALFWGALSLQFAPNGAMLCVPAEILAIALPLGIVLSCWMLVCEAPMFALKFKHYSWKGNEIRYGFITASAILLALLGWGGFSAIVVLYVIVSALTQQKN